MDLVLVMLFSMSSLPIIPAALARAAPRRSNWYIAPASRHPPIPFMYAYMLSILSRDAFVTTSASTVVSSVALNCSHETRHPMSMFSGVLPPKLPRSAPNFVRASTTASGSIGDASTSSWTAAIAWVVSSSSSSPEMIFTASPRRTLASLWPSLPSSAAAADPEAPSVSCRCRLGVGSG